jgi:Domain of unknown function (DUF4432)
LRDAFGRRGRNPPREYNRSRRSMKRRWQIWLVGRQTEGPPRDYDETVYNVVPYGDEYGDTLAVLHNAAGNLGVRVAFNTQQLPVFSLWKNAATPVQGYFTGLEPGTSCL